MRDRSGLHAMSGRYARRVARLLAVVATVLIVSSGSGCGTSGPAFQQETLVAGDSVVYVFRQSRSAGSASAFKLFANGEHVTNLSNGGYFPYPTPPGKVHLKAEMKANALNWGVGLALTAKPEIELEIESGKAYYVEFEFGGMGGPKLTRVDEAVGLASIRECRRTNPLP